MLSIHESHSLLKMLAMTPVKWQLKPETVPVQVYNMQINSLQHETHL